MRSTFSLLLYINRNKVRGDGQLPSFAESPLTERTLSSPRASPANPNNGTPKMQRPQMLGQTIV